MKTAFLIAGGAVLAYALWQHRNAAPAPILGLSSAIPAGSGGTTAPVYRDTGPDVSNPATVSAPAAERTIQPVSFIHPFFNTYQ